ncbi:MAG: chloride channel protein [Polyangia bacterium]
MPSLLLPLLDRLNLTRPSGRRWTRTLLISVVVGLLCGLAARILESLIDVGFRSLIGRYVDATSAHGSGFRLSTLLLPALGGLFSGLVVVLLCRPTRAHGTAVLIEAFHHHAAEMSLRDAALKALAAAVVISCGGSVGKEAAIAVLCAAIGATVARALRLPVPQRRVFLAAGCAAGVGAIFQTPLGGALFATSVLYSEPEVEAEALMPSIIASVTSYSTFMAFGGYGHRLLRGTATLVFERPIELVPYAVLAGCCALVSAVFFYALRLAAALRRRTGVPRLLAAGCAGLIGGVIALGLPQIMDARYEFVQGALDGSLGPPPYIGWALFFTLVVLAKCVATGLMMGAESAGGLFGPVVFMGGVTGAATGAIFLAAFPGVFPEPLRAALIPVGMAGVLAASLRTPLAAIVMVIEMTGSYGLIVPLMLVSVLSYGLGRRFGVYAEQVRAPADSPAHAGHSVRSWLESHKVASLVERSWPHILRSGTSLPELVSRIPASEHPVFLVVDDGRVAGFISAAELADVAQLGDASQLIVAADIMNTVVRPLRDSDDLYTAIERFREASVDTLPVVSRFGRSFVGVLQREELLKALREHSAQRSAAALREHSAFSMLANDVELDALSAELGTRRGDHIARQRVPDDIAGLSLREADYRRRYGAQVIAIETSAGELLAPPDPLRPLGREDVLVVMRPRAPSGVSPLARAQRPDRAPSP